MNLMSTIKNLHSVNEDRDIENQIDEATRYNAGLIKKAIAIANSKKYAHGDYDHAYAAIEKLKKGLADDPIVAKALKRANEGVEQNSDLDSLFEEALVEKNTPIANAWQKGAKSVKSGDIELVRGKHGVHTIKKKGKAIGDFSLEDDSDLWVVNIKGQRGQLTLDYLDELIPQLKESVEEGSNGLEEAARVSILKKNGYEIYASGKTSVGLSLFLMYKREIIAAGTKMDSKIIFGFSKKHKVSMFSNIYKKTKDFNYLIFPKYEDVIAHVMKHKIVTESVETDLDSLFEEELREAKWKLTSMSAKDAIKKYGKDKVRVGHLKMRDKSTSVEINEAVSMKNAKGIGFGKKGGYDKYVTLAKKKNAKSYKDVLKVLSREGLGKEELDNVADYVMNALGESVDFSLEDDSGLRDMITYTQLMEGANVKSTMSDLNKKMSLLKTDVKGGNINDIITRLTSIEIFMGKAIKDLNKLVKESVELEEAKGSDCTIQNDGRNNIAVCIDGLSFADARKGTRGAMMNIDGFKKKAKVAYADSKGKPTIPAVKKEIKALGAKNFYAKWQADSSSYKDDSVKIWFTK